MWLVLVAYNTPDKTDFLSIKDTNKTATPNLGLATNQPVNMDNVDKVISFMVNGKDDHTLLIHTNGKQTLVKNTWDSIARALTARYVTEPTTAEKFGIKQESKEVYEAQVEQPLASETPAQFVRRKNIMTTTAIQQG